MSHSFFGSKLNTVLLVILIILTVVALHMMKEQKQMYIDAWQKPLGQTPTINNTGGDYQPGAESAR